jgi:RNA polymerase sigma-70 factor (family 1)
VSTDDLYKQFQRVFEQHYNALCKYAFSFIKEKDVCEDIVQDVFARIWETRRDIVAADGVKFYLFTAVRNNCLTYLRREQRLPVYSLTEMDMEDTWPVAGTEPHHGDSVNYKALLSQGIDQLPPKCREVFLLSHLGDLSNQQVADSLGISIKTVNNQLWKALKFLKNFAKNIP